MSNHANNLKAIAEEMAILKERISYAPCDETRNELKFRYENTVAMYARFAKLLEKESK